MSGAEQIHPYVDNLHQWAPWLDMVPTIQTEYGEITQGVVAHQAWTGESASGALTLTSADGNTGIIYNLTFEGDPTQYVSGISYKKVKANNTTVIWYMTGILKHQLLVDILQ